MKGWLCIFVNMITADPGDVGAATKDLGWGRILVTSTSDLKVGVRGQVLSLGDKSGRFPRVFSAAASTSRMRCDAGSCQYYLQLSSSNLFTKSNVCKFDPIPDVLLLLFNASSVVKNVFTAAGVKCQKQEHTVVILDLCNRMFDCTTVNLSFIKHVWKRIICLFCVRVPLRPHTGRKHCSQPCQLSLQLKKTGAH